MNRSTRRTVMRWRPLARRGARADAGRPGAASAVARRTSRRPSMRRYAKYKGLQEGKNADYIPRSPRSIRTCSASRWSPPDGKVYTAGDVKTEVSIQSISKVFTLAQVIQEQGLESIEKRIGVDATGARFNSIVAVEAVQDGVGAGAPEMNPLVNPGAISATSMVKGGTRRRGLEEDHRHPQRLRRPPADACSRTSTSRSPTPTSATRPSAP